MTMGALNCSIIGITEINPDIGITLFPNPTFQNSLLQIKTLEGNKKISISLLDISGRTVYFETLNVNLDTGFSHELLLENINAGYYLLTLYIDNKKYVGRVIKHEKFNIGVFNYYFVMLSNN